MKGIILAGGTGSRLFPATKGISKQLIPVYDKPMIYYPLSILMLAGIKEIAVITTPQDSENFHRLLGNGKQWGLSFTYLTQPEPGGIAEAFLIAEDFIRGDNTALILGDNIFWGHGIMTMLEKASGKKSGATVFGYNVQDPERYGVVLMDENNRAVEIEEKPENPKSDLAVTGLYFYDKNVVEYTKELTPSKRGELEITDLNRAYMERGSLDVIPLGRGAAWLDTGTHESMLHASQFVEAIQTRQGLKISCPEEIAYKLGYINSGDVKRLASSMHKNEYGKYLLRMVENRL